MLGKKRPPHVHCRLAADDECVANLLVRLEDAGKLLIHAFAEQLKIDADLNELDGAGHELDRIGGLGQRAPRICAKYGGRDWGGELGSREQVDFEDVEELACRVEDRQSRQDG